MTAFFSAYMVAISWAIALVAVRLAERNPQVLGQNSLVLLTGMILGATAAASLSAIRGDQVLVALYVADIGWLAWCWWQVYKTLKPPKKRRRGRIATAVRVIKGRLAVVPRPGHQPS